MNVESTVSPVIRVSKKNCRLRTDLIMVALEGAIEALHVLCSAVATSGPRRKVWACKG